ncbi:hypothetical protein AMK33_14165 [Streptomyces sp. CB02400]|nr:hypothetical protein AMK33_14165 [Streptomyces sp. CB02400]
MPTRVRRVPWPLPTPRLPRPAEVIGADAFPLIRPYLIHHEREQERRGQRERRRAAVLATMGQDYAGVSA